MARSHDADVAVGSCAELGNGTAGSGVPLLIQAPPMNDPVGLGLTSAMEATGPRLEPEEV